MTATWNYKLPKKDFHDISWILSKLRREKLNLGLYLDKYIKWEKKNNEEKVSIVKMIEELQKNKKLCIPYSILPLDLYKNYCQRMTSLINALNPQKYEVMDHEAKLIWRLAINLGAGSVYETSIALHRNYSVPIISGSAVKGVGHHYAANYKDIAPEDKEKIFGAQKNRGKVIFFDALPIRDTNEDFITLDIMNVHYPDYYMDKEGRIPPSDCMFPRPIFFLAVEKIAYKFTVASKDKNLANKALELVKKAITEIGIGAKTSAGYGYFDAGEVKRGA